MIRTIIILFILEVSYCWITGNCSKWNKVFDGITCHYEDPIDQSDEMIQFLVKHDDKIRILQIKEKNHRTKNELKILKTLNNSPYIPKIILTETYKNLIHSLLSFPENGYLSYFVLESNYFDESHNILIFARKLFKALTEMHKKDVIYLGLNPKSIFIDSEYSPVIMDFERASNEIIIRHSPYGVNGYMSPEMVRHYSANIPLFYNHSHDIFSFGVVIYWLMKRRSPFKQKGFDYSAMIQYPIQFNKGDSFALYLLIKACLKPEKLRSSDSEITQMLEDILLKNTQRVLDNDIELKIIDYLDVIRLKQFNSFNFLYGSVILLMGFAFIFIFLFFRKKDWLFWF